MARFKLGDTVVIIRNDAVGIITEVMTEHMYGDETIYEVTIKNSFGIAMVLESDLTWPVNICNCGAQYVHGYDNIHSRWCAAYKDITGKV